MKKGFTLIELIVVMGVLAILYALTNVNLINSYRTPLQRNQSAIFISDIRGQQAKAMTNAAYYGIYLGNTSYTLFTGQVYNPSDTSNFSINLDTGFDFVSVTFPSKQIVFTPVSGDIVNWLAGNDSLTLKDEKLNTSTVLKINKYGATY